MKRINSTEKRALLEHELLKGSRCHPDSASYLTNCSTTNSHTLKRSESSSTLRSTRHDLSIIEERYQSLEEDYQNLLQETKRKREIFLKQKQQLQRYKTNHQRDTKQIERLQSLISFAKKADFTPKKYTNETQEPSANMRKHKPASSLPKDKHFFTQKVAVQTIDIANEKGTGTGLRKMGRKQDSSARFSRHKFVPSICLN